MRIRKAVGDDTRSILELYQELNVQHRRGVPDLGDPAGVSRTYEFLMGAFDDPKDTILVAEADDGVVGLVYVLIREEADHPLLAPQRKALVDDVVVRRSHRGEGIGSALVRAAEAWALERGVDEFEAEVFQFNEEAAGFYQSLGYVVESRIVVKKAEEEA